MNNLRKETNLMKIIQYFLKIINFHNHLKILNHNLSKEILSNNSHNYIWDFRDKIKFIKKVKILKLRQ